MPAEVSVQQLRALLPGPPHTVTQQVGSRHALGKQNLVCSTHCPPAFWGVPPAWGAPLLPRRRSPLPLPPTVSVGNIAALYPRGPGAWQSPGLGWVRPMWTVPALSAPGSQPWAASWDPLPPFSSGGSGCPMYIPVTDNLEPPGALPGGRSPCPAGAGSVPPWSLPVSGGCTRHGTPRSAVGPTPCGGPSLRAVWPRMGWLSLQGTFLLLLWASLGQDWASLLPGQRWAGAHLPETR